MSGPFLCANFVIKRTDAYGGVMQKTEINIVNMFQSTNLVLTQPTHASIWSGLPFVRRGDLWSAPHEDVAGGSPPPTYLPPEITLRIYC